MKLTTVKSTAIRIKEASFLAEVTKHKEFERSKEIKWFKCIGTLPLDEQSIAGSFVFTNVTNLEIVAKREQDNKVSNKTSSRVVHRKVDNVGTREDSLGENNSIKTANPFLPIFMDAGWKVVTRNRLISRLQRLRRVIQNHGKSRQDINKFIESTPVHVEEDESKDIPFFSFREEYIKSDSIPFMDEDVFESTPEVITSSTQQVESFPVFAAKVCL